MVHKDDQLLEKVIIFLVIVVGVGLAYNQFSLIKQSTNTFLNSIALLLILILFGSIAWFAIIKENKHEQSEHHKQETPEHETKLERNPLTFFEKISYSFVALIAVLILFNQFQISEVSAMMSGSSSGVGNFVKTVSHPLGLAGSSSGKSGTIIGPQINPDGRTTHLVEWKTISETPAPKTENVIATVVPTGTPFYILDGPGADKLKGATFDDPITSQKVWASLLGSSRFGRANEIQLTPDEQKRWQKLTSVFTCDFCCGGPNSVTTINQCGCAHSYAWQGMAKFFIKYYPQYADEQILGEMTKWKALWYPKGMIQDYLVYTGQQSANTLTSGGSTGIKQQFMQAGNTNSQQTQATATPVEQLPSMVGGC